MISRRSFLGGGLILSGAFALEGFVLEPKDIEVQEVLVKIKDLPPAFRGFTICQLTDIHHGPLVGLDFLERVVAKANSLKADLAVLTGDFIDREKSYMRPAMEALSRLKARLGTLAALGNHDNFIGRDFSARVISSHSIQLLQNSHVMIESGGDSLCIAGVRDYLEDRPEAARALNGVAPSVPRILLSHHPDYAEFLPQDVRVDLVLSGHTHGGQVRLPFSFAPIVPSDFGQKYSGGLVRNGDTQVYVSRGVGVVLIPVRFNCPPEITLIRLVA
ncbi:MAG: hypothetical protein A2V21_306360 [Deltaproteobacteria bacterium GWC2_55_46]|nr:MAG: hypothetical protein A2Z79_00455 [Deltaproteobacteria bacterium GWA2_55_82]OGQ64905.1 MAG: hypothetical protein A3I81_04560 [Deltaproteobacteria bacterium RIFCSPLOWO2_02_FULL_55_12]OIJ75080.1 MAG: hypothetical protein A2V21_306360 [Deltaproteobacteria bacterium GWC2_55_46]